jgi:hypothetical protein
MVMLVLAIFVIGMLPMAIAEEEDNQLEGERNGIKWKQGPIDDRPKLGKVLDERIKLAKERYGQAKEHRILAKERYQEAHQRFVQIKDKVKACANDKEECPRLKSELKVGVKARLERTAELIEKSLDKIINRIEASTLEDKEALIAEIEAKKAEFVAELEEIKTISEDATNEELKEAIKSLKEKWQEAKKIQQKAIASLINSKLNNLVERISTTFSEKLQNRIDDLSENGLDTTELETLKAEYDSLAEELTDLQQQAHDKIVEGDLEAHKDLQQQVKEQIREVKEKLREFMKEFRELKSGVVNETSDEEEEEEVEESETEEDETESDDNSEDDEEQEDSEDETTGEE